MTSRPERFLLYAPNVHTGGGVVLLRTLLEEWPETLALIGWLDVRAKSKLNLPKAAQISWVSPSIGSRLWAEITLAKVALSGDKVLCFHGLPPLLKNQGKVSVFQQNRNYLNLISLDSFSLRTRLRLRFEQSIAYVFRHRCASYLVQTPSMARDIQKWYGQKLVKIRVLPFMFRMEQLKRVNSSKWNFIYVADGEAHKNHRQLVKAWIVLALEGIRPTLALTLSGRDAALMVWIQRQVDEHGLLICNLGQLAHEDVLKLYQQADALVFPSVSESFGLPLIEARKNGLPVVASEMDFVRDVCEPVHTFDPRSSTSIARAIRRFLGKAETPVQPLGASEFISALLLIND